MEPQAQFGKDVMAAPAPPAPQSAPSFENPLRPVVGKWLELLKRARQHKDNQFQLDAQECLRFFNGPYDFLYKKDYSGESAAFRYNGGGEDDCDMPAPTFEMTANVVAEMVQIFGPVLYHKNPDRKVTPRQFPVPPVGLLSATDPTMQMAEMQAQMVAQLSQAREDARAQMIEWYLNYTPTELDLKTHCRKAIDEALIKGMGLLWTELYQAKGSDINLVGSFYDTVDNLLADPDAEDLGDAKWVSRRRVHPVWEVERLFQLEPGALKGTLESVGRQAETSTSPDGDYDRKRGASNDLIVYHEIYSKMGLGGRLVGAPQELRQVLEQFGDFCYLAVAEDVPYPLNMPPAVLNGPMGPDVLERLEWPTPFWLDDDWPFTPIAFHWVPRQLWPMSHLKPAMGELKFLNWAYSFLASKVRTTCRDFIAIRASAAEELKDIIMHGKDLTLIKINEVHGGAIDQIVSFLQHPAINGDVFKVIELILHQFERRTGLSELLYGESARQMRSAEEANLKHSALQVRPDDMATKVEEAMTLVARKEAIAIRWHLQAKDIAPIVGEQNALYWQQLVLTADPFALVRQLEYRIEAGSTKKPNHERDADNLQQAMQILFTPLYQYAQATGLVGPVNALITDWAKSVGMDASKYLLMAPPPPPPAPAEGEGGGDKGKGGEGSGERGGPPQGGQPPQAGGPPQQGPPAAPMPPVQMPAGATVPPGFLEGYLPPGAALLPPLPPAMRAA